MQLPNEIHKILKQIFDTTKPVSVFVYGSQAKGDMIDGSDFEIGILYKEADRVSRTELSKMHSIDNLRIYPFIYEDFTKYNLDTPFPLATYMRSLLDGGAKTVFGEEVVEDMEPPQILVSDLLEEISFQIARALGALLSFRESDLVTAKDQFVKSVLYGSQTYLMIVNGDYVLRYDEIVAKIQHHDIDDEFKTLVNNAFEIRQGEGELTMQMIFTAISYFNQVVRRRIKQEFVQGNRVILEGAELT